MKCSTKVPCVWFYFSEGFPKFIGWNISHKTWKRLLSWYQIFHFKVPCAVFKSQKYNSYLVQTLVSWSLKMTTKFKETFSTYFALFSVNLHKSGDFLLQFLQFITFCLKLNHLFKHFESAGQYRSLPQKWSFYCATSISTSVCYFVS